MRLKARDLPLAVALIPVIALGLFPLVMLPLLGFLGFVVLGLLTGFAAVMAQLEEQGAHAYQVVSHGGISRNEQASYGVEMDRLMHTLNAVKIASAGLVVLGVGGFALTS